MWWVINAIPRPLYCRQRLGTHCKAGTHCKGGWVGLLGRFGRVRKFRPATVIRSPDRPARSELLQGYWLRYPGPQNTTTATITTTTTTTTTTTNNNNTRSHLLLINLFTHLLAGLTSYCLVRNLATETTYKQTKIKYRDETRKVYKYDIIGRIEI
jgi:hypothetical protein